MNKKELRELLQKLDPEQLQIVLEFVNCMARKNRRQAAKKKAAKGKS